MLKINIFEFLTLKFSLNNSAHAIAVPPVASTSSIRRIEGGMLSYHADADINTNPFELGLDRLVYLDSKIDFIGKDSLKKIQELPCQL